MFINKISNEIKQYVYKSNSWKEFFNALKNKESDIKGEAFELLCFCYLSTDRIFRILLKKVWHESDCPKEIYTKKLHLLRPEIGVDLICEDINGKYWAVQCKYRFPETDNLTYDEVSSFFDVTGRSKTKKHLSNRLLITNYFSNKRSHIPIDNTWILFFAIHNTGIRFKHFPIIIMQSFSCGLFC